MSHVPFLGTLEGLVESANGSLLRVEGLAQTSSDPLPAPEGLTLPIGLHLNCAAYMALSSVAPHRPPPLVLQTRHWAGSALHACCPGSGSAGTASPHQAPLCLPPTPRLLWLFFQAPSLPEIIKACLCLLPISPMGAAHTPGTLPTWDA